jgi:hypothetical protein
LPAERHSESGLAGDLKDAILSAQKHEPQKLTLKGGVCGAVTP